MPRYRGVSQQKECKCVGCDNTSPRLQRMKCVEDRPPDKIQLPLQKRKLPTAPGGKIVEFKLWDLEPNRTVPSSSLDSIGNSQESGSADISVDDDDIIEKVIKTPVVHKSTRSEPPAFSALHCVLDEVCERRYHHLIEPVYLTTKKDLEEKAMIEARRKRLAQAAESAAVGSDNLTYLTGPNGDPNVQADSTTEYSGFDKTPGIVSIKTERFSDDEDLTCFETMPDSDSTESGYAFHSHTAEDYTIVKNEYFSDDNDGSSDKHSCTVDSGCVKQEPVPYSATSVDHGSTKHGDSGESPPSLKIDAVFSLTSSVSKAEEEEKDIDTKTDLNIVNTDSKELLAPVKTEKTEDIETLQSKELLASTKTETTEEMETLQSPVSRSTADNETIAESETNVDSSAAMRSEDLEEESLQSSLSVRDEEMDMEVSNGNTEPLVKTRTRKPKGKKHSQFDMPASKTDECEEMETTGGSNDNTYHREFITSVKTEEPDEETSPLEKDGDKSANSNSCNQVKTDADMYGIKHCFVKLENIKECLNGRTTINVSVVRRRKYLAKRLAAKRKERREREKERKEKELQSRRYLVSDPGTARFFMLYLGTSRLVVPANQFGRRPMGYLINFGIHLKIPSSQIMLLPFELTIRAICDQKKNVSDRYRLARECPDYEQPPMPESLMFEKSEPEAENPRPETESTARTDVIFCKPDILNAQVQTKPSSLLDKKYFVRHEDFLDVIEESGPGVLKESLLNFKTGSLLLKFKLKSPASDADKDVDAIDVCSNVITPKTEKVDPKMNGAGDPILSSLSVTTNDCSIGSLNMPASENSVPTDSFQLPDADSIRIKIEPLDPYYDSPSNTQDYQPMEIGNFDEPTHSAMDLNYSFDSLGKMTNPIDDIHRDDLNLETKLSPVDDPDGSEMISESSSNKDAAQVHTGSVDRIQRLKDALRQKTSALETIRRTLTVKKEKGDSS